MPSTVRSHYPITLYSVSDGIFGSRGLKTHYAHSRALHLHSVSYVTRVVPPQISLLAATEKDEAPYEGERSRRDFQRGRDSNDNFLLYQFCFRILRVIIAIHLDNLK